MRKGDFGKKIVAAIVSMTMAFTMAGNYYIKAQDQWNRTNFIANGGFENKTQNWDVNTSIISREAYVGKNGEVNSTNSYHYWSENGDFLSLTQKVKLPIGTYKLSVSGMGKISDLTLSVDGTDASVRLADSGWEEWNTYQTGSFTIKNETEITIRIEGNISADYWGNLDDVILYQRQETDTSSFSYLQQLIERVPKDFSAMGFSDDSIRRLEDALSCAKECHENSPSEQIKSAGKDLEEALSQLRFYSSVAVKKVEEYNYNDSIRDNMK